MPGPAVRAQMEAVLDGGNVTTLVTDETWATLSEGYDQRQMMEAVFTVGQYNLVAMWLNSLGVQLEPGFEGFPP